MFSNKYIKFSDFFFLSLCKYLYDFCIIQFEFLFNLILDFRFFQGFPFCFFFSYGFFSRVSNILWLFQYISFVIFLGQWHWIYIYVYWILYTHEHTLYKEGIFHIFKWIMPFVCCNIVGFICMYMHFIYMNPSLNLFIFFFNLWNCSIDVILLLLLLIIICMYVCNYELGFM